MEFDLGITDSVQIINTIVKNEYPIQLAGLAQDIFASGGQSHGRDWDANKASTIRRKGGNSPNIESGQLKNWLSTPGNLMDDNYMDELPSPIKSRKNSEKNKSGKGSNNTGNDGYEYANAMRHFDDIGRTGDDQEYILNQIINEIAKQYRG